MAYDFDPFTTVSNTATAVSFAFLGNLGTTNTIEVRIIGTDLGYVAGTGAFGATAAITQLVLFDTTTNAALQTIDISPGDAAGQMAAAANATALLAAALGVQADIAADLNLPAGIANINGLYGPGGTLLTLSLFDAGNALLGTIEVSGTGFVQDTTLGKVSSLTSFDAAHTQLGTHTYAAGSEPTVAAAAIALGSQDVLYSTLLAGNDTLTNNAQTSDGHTVSLDPGLGTNTINGSATFGGFVSYATYNLDSVSGVQIDLANQTVTHGLTSDTLSNIGGAEGSSFNDTLQGSNGNDFLSGGAGNDTINGGGVTLDPFGLGFDILVGGRGNDTFNITLSTPGSSALNYIVNYSQEQGTQGVFVNLDSADHTVGLQTVSGGTAADTFGDTDLVGSVHNVVGTSNADIFFGSAQDDVFTGGGGGDQIDGGGLGADQDILIYSQTRNLNPAFNFASGLTVTFTGSGAGSVTDNLQTPAFTDTFTDIELVTGTQNADTFTSSAAGSIAATGNGGNDIFDGTLGSADTVDYSLEALAGGNGLGGIGIIANLSADAHLGVASGHVRDTFTFTDSLTDIEHIVGSVFADFIYGGATAEILEGNGGGDAIFGGAGADTLRSDSSLLPNGTLMLDILVGDAGADTFDGPGNGSAIVDYALETGVNGVIVNLDSVLHDGVQAHQATDTHGDTDTLNQIASVIGTTHDDIMWGSGADEFFTPGPGTDTVHGGGGFDQLFYNGFIALNTAFGQATDAFNYGTFITVTFSGDGSSGSVQGDISISPNAGTDTFDGVERVLATQLADTFTGSDTNDAHNTYVGMGGADVFNGSSNILVHDIVDYSFDAQMLGSAGVTVHIDTGTATDGFGDTDTLNDIEDAIGTAAADTFVGNAKANFFDGRGGADSMTGGDGNDRYSVDNSSDAVVEGNGVNSGIDTIFSTIDILGLAVNVENLELAERLLLSPVHGVGNASDNVITGNSLANILEGLDGNDTLDGQGGADTLVGGNGDDIYVIGDAGDTADETGTTGNDTIKSLISFSLADTAHVLGGAIENLQLLGSAVNGTGNALANILTGNSLANTLDGGLGADAMHGGDGSDTYIVDNVGDIVDETNTAASGGDDQVLAFVNFSLAGATERLSLMGTAISGTGNNLNNTITGNNLANILDGGTGADTLIGGLGNDTYVVDVAADTVTEAAGGGTGDTVRSSRISLNLANYAEIENLALAGNLALNLTGNSGINQLSGNDGANILDGLGGNDTLTGGAGADVFKFGFNYGNDVITDFHARYFRASLDGVQQNPDVNTTASGSGSVVLNAAQTSAAVSLTVAGLSGAAALAHIHRGALEVNGPVIFDLNPPAAADFTLDQTWTGAGLAADRANLISGNLYFNAHTAAHPGGEIRGQILAVAGDTGNDRIDVSALGIGTLETLNAISADVAGSARITVFANGVASSLTTMGVAKAFFNASHFIFNTAVVNDIKGGGALADDIFGGGGNDQLAGNAGNDRLFGETGNDTSNGGLGNDLMAGGLGNDVLTGGAGNDTFLFDTALNRLTNVDRITDFSPNVAGNNDTIKLENTGAGLFNALALGTLSAAAFFKGAGAVAGHDATDRIIYNTTTGDLFYDRDGLGGAAAIKFATLTTHPAALTNLDFLII